VKTVLSAMPSFFLTIFKMPRWAHRRIDRFRRSFLWKGEDPNKVQGGHCLVNWKTCTRPRKCVCVCGGGGAARSSQGQSGTAWPGAEHALRAVTAINVRGMARLPVAL
jgi:hypothetical protein